MKVSECMTQQVELARPTMSLSEAAQKMRDGDFGSLPVQDGDRLVGMITDRDIVIRAVAAGLNPDMVQVQDVMSKSVRYCFEDENCEDVARNLGDNQIRRLPVLNRNKKLVGILSLGDLAQTRSAAEEAEGALSRISENKKQTHSSYALR